jgi:hypothetical protein
MYEGTEIWRKEILDKTFSTSNISGQADIAWLMSSKNKDKWKKICVQ